MQGGTFLGDCVTQATRLFLQAFYQSLGAGFRVRSSLGQRILCCGLWIMFLVLTRQDGQVLALFPLVGHESIAIIQDRPGCYMDGEFHPFGDRWSPVFEPQGLMVCVKCECMAIDKKGIIQFKGNTVCKNIKDLCPEPECDHPVLKQGKCCKSCEGNEDVESSIAFRRGTSLPNDIHSLDHAKAYKPQEFQAILVGRHVFGGPVRTRAVAVAHISVMKGRVTFGLRYSRLDRPKSFLLQDIHGNVLFEKSIQQNTKGEKKVCGVWPKIPAFYLRYFRHEKLFATLTTFRYPGGIVTGKIVPKSVSNTETFSAILTPSKPEGIGGLARIEHSPGTRHFSYIINLEGPRGTWKRGNVHIAVLRGSSVLYQTVGSITATTGTVSGSWKLSKRYRKQFAHARFSVSVTFLNQPSLKGMIRPRLQCGVFQAVLSRGQNVDLSQPYSAGSAVLLLREDGSLDYSILASGLTDNITRVRLEGPPWKDGNTPRILGNLIKSDNSSHHFPLQEWIHGSYKKLEAGDVSRLLSNQLFLSIATTRHRIRQLRGRLVSFEYGEQFIKTATPVNLVPAHTHHVRDVAQMWLNLGPDCVLHFDATVTGRESKSSSLDVVLGSHDNRQRTFLLKQPIGKMKMLNGYRHIAGETANIPDDLLLALDRGLSFVQINDKKTGQAVFIGNVTLSNSCWRYSNDVDVDYAVEDETIFRSNDHDDVPVCRFNGQIYEVGSTWLPDVNPECTTCSCEAPGKIRCDEMICPNLACDNQELKPGDCCKSCPNEDDSETCQIGKDPRKYRAHSVWHPYLPMQGFEKCAVCRCYLGGRVECDKPQCPVPNCHKSQWITSEIDPCCHECGSSPSTQMSNEEPQQDHIHEACIFLKETKANGEQWHPEIHNFGQARCILCECQAGIVKCERAKCPDLKCPRRIRLTGTCCDECEGEMKNTVVGSGDAGKLRETEWLSSLRSREGEEGKARQGHSRDEGKVIR